MHYHSWNISVERQRHEWMRLRRSIVAVRIGVLACGHLAYFAFCGVGYLFGTMKDYGHSIGIGMWSLVLIGILLLALEFVYAHLCPCAPPRYVIRENGITLYGQDGPAAHFGWERTRQINLESDPRRREFRSLVLSGGERQRWLRRASQVIIPLPSPEAESEVVSALGAALIDSGMSWTAQGDTVILSRRAAA